jgi:hypothetical protein
MNKKKLKKKDRSRHEKKIFPECQVSYLNKASKEAQHTSKDDSK